MVKELRNIIEAAHKFEPLVHNEKTGESFHPKTGYLVAMDHEGESMVHIKGAKSTKDVWKATARHLMSKHGYTAKEAVRTTHEIGNAVPFHLYSPVTAHKTFNEPHPTTKDITRHRTLAQVARSHGNWAHKNLGFGADVYDYEE